MSISINRNVKYNKIISKLDCCVCVCVFVMCVCLCVCPDCIKVVGEKKLHLYLTSPSVGVALRRIGGTHLKLTSDMRPYSSIFLSCRMLYTLLSTIFHNVNFEPIIPVESKLLG